MVAYPERKGMRFHPVHVSTRADVISLLEAAIPGFDEKTLRPESDATQVVFAGTLNLTDLQLIQLGIGEI